MEEQKSCILCLENKANQTQRVSKHKLIRLYKKSFGIDAGNVINQDLIYYHCANCDVRFFTLQDGSIPVGDNDFYSRLNQLEWYYMDDKLEYRYAREVIDKYYKGEDPHILEVGCGKAAFTKFLSDREKEHYVGLEFSTEAKAMAAKDNINIENISIEDYANRIDSKCDIACSFQVLEHVSNPYSFIESQIKCLKNDDVNNGGGGSKLLIIAVPSEDSFLQYCVNGTLNMPPHHVIRFSDNALKSIAKIFNITLIEIYHEPLQDVHIEWYREVMWAKKFLDTPLIHRGFERKMINKIGKFFRKNIKVDNTIRGHTALAVYKI